MNVAIAKVDPGRALSDAFTLAGDRLPGGGEIGELRREAFESYERVGLPHRRIEDWKYTDLRVLMREVLPLAPEPDATALNHGAAALKLHAIPDVRRRSSSACGRPSVQAPRCPSADAAASI